MQEVLYILRLVVMRVMILARHTSLHRLGLIFRIFGNVNVNPSGIFMVTHPDGPQIEIMMLNVLIAKMIIIMLTVLQPFPIVTCFSFGLSLIQTDHALIMYIQYI